MLFFGLPNSLFKIGILLILSVWAVVVIHLMYQSYYITDPYNSALTGTEIYGHNNEGAFTSLTVVLLIEYVILLAALLPFSFSSLYWLRVLVLQIIFGGWWLVLAMGAMHSGQIYAIHLFAVLIINIFLFCC